MPTLPTISALPSPPTITESSADFNTDAFAFLGAFPTFQAQLNAFAAALPLVVTGTDYAATSTTSLTIGTGSKSLTIETGKNFQVGQSVRIAYTTTPANYMDGQVTSYNSGTGALVVNVASVGGAGTQALWTISLQPGAGSFATLAGAETLTNKTLAAPTIATITNGGTITLPTGTRTLVARDTTDTLTNKTFDTASNTLKVNGNTITAAAGTATLTMPNSSDTLVGRATTDTLTNKTLTAPAINGGTLSAANINASNAVNDTGAIAAASPGFRGVPAATLDGSAGRLAGSQIGFILADAGKRVINTAGGWLIPANASVAFPIGTLLGGYNDSGSSQTLAITTDTLRLDGTALTGPRTVPLRGRWMAEKVKTTEWVVSGSIS